MTLPTNGQLNWGTPLNNEITNDEATIATTASGLAAHEANSPADPHGDRAYAASLVAPITADINGIEAFIQTDNTGHILEELLPAQIVNHFFDVRNSTYGAVGNGTTDDAPAINAALAAAVAAGGGIVWVADGTYGIGETLVIGNGVILWLSSGAIIQRISPISAPTVMLANYSSGNAAATGNMIVEGGTWDAVGTSNQGSTCQVFSFVNAGSIRLQNISINTVANGACSYASFYGCNNVLLEDLVLNGAAPSVSRGSCITPCFRIEQCNSSNIPGRVAGDYNHQMCNGFVARNCSHRALTHTDGSGLFSAWHSLCGTIGTVDSSSLFHTNIKVNDCDSIALASYGIYALQWNLVTFLDCFLGTPTLGQYSQNWVASAPATLNWSHQDNWHTLTLDPGWTGTVSYRLLRDGNVQIHGFTANYSGGFVGVKSLNANNPLPSNYRSPTGATVVSFSENNNNPIQAFVGNNGVIGFNAFGISQSQIQFDVIYSVGI